MEKGGILKIMTDNLNSLAHISQSLDPIQENLQAQVLDLQKQIETLGTALKYLAYTNAELSRDMEMIYSSLEEVISKMSDPADSMLLPFNLVSDEELIN